VRRPLAFWLDVAVKGALVLLLAFGAFSGLDQFAGKAFGWRLIGYSVATVVVPMLWILRGKRPPYPYAVDILFTLPFLVDTVGNALDLYDSIDWWDDLNHFVNWAILCAAFGQLLLHFPYDKWTMAGLIVGFGSVSGVIWEIAEYFTFVRGGPEEATAYTDTLGDLALDLGGAIVAAWITAWVLRPRLGAAGSAGRRGSSALRQPV
jgi:hypothetical protein